MLQASTILYVLSMVQHVARFFSTYVPFSFFFFFSFYLKELGRLVFQPNQLKSYLLLEIKIPFVFNAVGNYSIYPWRAQLYSNQKFAHYKPIIVLTISGCFLLQLPTQCQPSQVFLKCRCCKWQVLPLVQVLPRLLNLAQLSLISCVSHKTSTKSLYIFGRVVNSCLIE